VEGTGEGPSIHGVARNGHLELVKALISAGTDVNVKDDYGATPLHYAAKGNFPEVVKYLLEMGADVHAKDDMGKTPLHYVVEGSDIYEATKPDEDPSPEERRRIEIMRLLIERGANVNAKDHEGRTPLHYAAFSDTPFKLARYLVDRGTDINAKDEGGYTPLDGAELMANDELVEYLLKRGAKRGEEI
jgi:ankyrin repeat protein